LTAFVVAHKPSPYEFPKLNYFPQMPQSSENPVTIEGADLGRHLFYDPILSKNYDISCASCHRQEMAFSDAPNAFTKGNEGMLTNRNTMPYLISRGMLHYFGMEEHRPSKTRSIILSEIGTK